MGSRAYSRIWDMQLHMYICVYGSWILEGGYCSDTKYEEKLHEKTQQHQEVTNMLTQYGYDVYLKPLPLGFAGTVYKSNLEALMHFGMNKTKAKGTLRKLHTHAITCLHNFIKARRYLERHNSHFVRQRPRNVAARARQG